MGHNPNGEKNVTPQPHTPPPYVKRWRSEEGAFHILVYKAGRKYIHCILIQDGAVRSKRLPITELKFMHDIPMTVDEAITSFSEIAAWFPTQLTIDARTFLGLSPLEPTLEPTNE